MDAEPNKASQSAGAERSVNHPKPFFYVQPPMQPYYTYQWQMNHPFSHQSFPGSGFHFSRPYMVPYSYLQYPGYVMPQAGMHPVDYRRIYERGFPHAATCDAALRQNQHGNAVHRETMCAGAQTEPCDALNRLIECLDQLRAGDSSQTSASSSSLTEESKTLERKLRVESEVENNYGERFIQEDSSLDEEEEGKCQNLFERHSASSQTQSANLRKQGETVQSKDAVKPGEEMDWQACNASHPSSHLSPAQCSSTLKTEDLSVDKLEDVSCCILSLPFEKVLSSGVYGSSVTPTSVSSPLSYTYPSKLAHERVSVLSPSLDELSSHDELLSTDIDDIDLLQTQIYTKEKLSDVTSRKGHELCLLYPRRLKCATCGSHAFKQLRRTKTCCYKDVEDSDDVDGSVMAEVCERCLHCATMKGHLKKMHSQFKHRLRPSHKRDDIKDQRQPSHLECYYCEKCMSSPDNSSTRVSRVAQPERRCTLTSDHLVWENVGGNARSKSCRSQPLPQRQQRPIQRKSRFKSQVCPGSRTGNSNNNNDDNDDYNDEGDDNEEEEQEVRQYHKGKGDNQIGITKRGGARS